jgi:hypothetical protein
MKNKINVSAFWKLLWSHIVQDWIYEGHIELRQHIYCKKTVKLVMYSYFRLVVSG